MSSTHIQSLRSAIQPVRDRLIAHPVYQHIRTPAALRIFMEHHVFAVWDFMSLLKALQIGLTGVAVPWMPRGSANTRYLINEIVVGEESDVDEAGNRTSHFELYLRAMDQAGAGTGSIHVLLHSLAAGTPLRTAIARIPEKPIRDFLDFTFDTIGTEGLHGIAAVFTFGREDLIADMFLRIVQDLSPEMPEDLHVFTYYLERHIEVDGDHHSHLAMAMLEELCGDDEKKWAAATRLATTALERRIGLWDGVVKAI